MAYQKIDHDFKNEALSYDAKPNYQPCIKLSFWFNKLPEVSYEAFHSHWETVHADLTIATKYFGLCKVQRYVYALKNLVQEIPVLTTNFDDQTVSSDTRDEAEGQEPWSYASRL